MSVGTSATSQALSQVRKLTVRSADAAPLVGPLLPEFRGRNFRGRGAVLAGVHDSNANYLRYLAAGVG